MMDDNGEFIINLTGQKIHFPSIDRSNPIILSEKIGAGTYGDVYKAHLHGINNSKLYAVKYYREDTKTLRSVGIHCTTIRELNALQEYVHANILKLEGFFVGEHKTITSYINSAYSNWISSGNAEIEGYPVVEGQAYVFAAYEYCPGGDLRKLLLQRRSENPERPDLWGLPLLETKYLMYQLLNGLSFLHNGKMCHRDLKPDNLMLDRPGLMSVLKIGDLGLCRELRSHVGELTPTVCTIFYRPLEVLLGRMKMPDGSVCKYETADQNGLSQHYGLAIDIWSAGCILAEMILGRAIFKGTQEFEIVTRITKALGTPTEEEWINCTRLQYYPQDKKNSHFFPCEDKMQHLNCLLEGKLDIDGLDLLSRMLTYNPDLRIPAAKALSHDWFSDINFSRLDGIGVYNWIWQAFQYQIEDPSYPIEKVAKDICATTKLGHIINRPDFDKDPLMMEIGKHIKKVMNHKKKHTKNNTVVGERNNFPEPFVKVLKNQLLSRSALISNEIVNSNLQDDRSSTQNDENKPTLNTLPTQATSTDKKRKPTQDMITLTNQPSTNIYQPKDEPNFPNLLNTRETSPKANKIASNKDNTKPLDTDKKMNLDYNPNSIFSKKMNNSKQLQQKNKNDENKNTIRAQTIMPNQKTERAVRSTTRAQTLQSYLSKQRKIT